MDGAGTGSADGPRVVAGRYTLLSRLGAGGMATVWRARDEVLGREVAVKEVLPPAGLSDADRAVLFERTRREARAAARLDHPSAVTVYDVVEQGGSPFLVMELVPARTLAEIVRGEGPLAPPQAAQVGLAVLGALEAAHARGIVHRDVKPSNVLIAGDRTAPGRVVLTDFGIATSAGDVSITGTGLLLGSPSYIAPERARGRAPGPASDLWSLGATLFTAVEGRPAYDGGDPLSTVTAVVAGEQAPFALAGPLEPVITGLLARDPADRLDAGSVQQLLEQVLRQPTASAGTSASCGTTRATTQPDAVRRAQRTAALRAGDLRAATAPRPRRAERQVDDAGRQPAVDDGARRPAAEARMRRRAPEPRTPHQAPEDPRQPHAPEDPRQPHAPEGRAGRRPMLPATVVPAPRAAPPVREQTSGRGGRATVVLVAVLLLVVGLGGAALLRAGPTTGTASSALSPPAAPSPTPSASPARPGGVPAGWLPYTHPTQGWTLWYPPTYTVTDRGALKQFRDESTRFTLRVSEDAAPRQGVLAATQAFATAASQQLGRYAQLRLGAVTFGSWDAAELEFTYFDAGADLHVLNRAFVSGGRMYSLYWQTNADRFSPSLPAFEQIASSFAPAPAP